MPNNVTSTIEIRGTKEQIDKLIKDTKLKLEKEVDNQFDFNGIIPMPDELHDTVSPPQIVATDEEAKKINEEYKEKNKGNTFPGTDQYYRAISEAEQERRIKEHGAVNWYDWANKHWGTKWNAYDVHYFDHGEDENGAFLVLELDTAWGPPENIFEKLEEQGMTINGQVTGEVDEPWEIGDGGPFYRETRVEYYR